MLGSALVALGVGGLAVGGCGSSAPVASHAVPSAPAPAPTPAPASGMAAAAQTAAVSFLRSYVDPDGRVVRKDQGGDTVSEGQGYAMLLDVAVGDPSQFAAVWHWSQVALQRPDGLLAYHWADGRVLDDHSATDADLDITRALLLAGAKWHDTTWTAQGKAYAAAILANETASQGGRLWLVAGPWARTVPLVVDPSYFDPATFELLASATHDPRWSRVEASSAQIISADTNDGHLLPSDWAQVNASGRVEASPPPSGGEILYGYDAFRTLVRQDDDCVDGPGRRLDAALAPLADRTASASGDEGTFHQNGSGAQPGGNPLMLVGAAGSARAAGDPATTAGDLQLAAATDASHPTYFLAAWVALARYLLTTTALTSCAR